MTNTPDTNRPPSQQTIEQGVSAQYDALRRSLPPGLLFTIENLRADLIRAPDEAARQAIETQMVENVGFGIATIRNRLADLGAIQGGLLEAYRTSSPDATTDTHDIAIVVADRILKAVDMNVDESEVKAIAEEMGRIRRADGAEQWTSNSTPVIEINLNNRNIPNSLWRTGNEGEIRTAISGKTLAEAGVRIGTLPGTTRIDPVRLDEIFNSTSLITAYNIPRTRIALASVPAGFTTEVHLETLLQQRNPTGGTPATVAEMDASALGALLQSPAASAFVTDYFVCTDAAGNVLGLPLNPGDADEIIDALYLYLNNKSQAEAIGLQQVTFKDAIQHRTEVRKLTSGGVDGRLAKRALAELQKNPDLINALSASSKELTDKQAEIAENNRLLSYANLLKNLSEIKDPAKADDISKKYNQKHTNDTLSGLRKYKGNFSPVFTTATPGTSPNLLNGSGGGVVLTPEEITAVEVDLGLPASLPVIVKTTGGVQTDNYQGVWQPEYEKANEFEKEYKEAKKMIDKIEKSLKEAANILNEKLARTDFTATPFTTQYAALSKYINITPGMGGAPNTFAFKPDSIVSGIGADAARLEREVRSAMGERVEAADVYTQKEVSLQDEKQKILAKGGVTNLEGNEACYAVIEASLRREIPSESARKDAMDYLKTRLKLTQQTAETSINAFSRAAEAEFLSRNNPDAIEEWEHDHPPHVSLGWKSRTAAAVGGVGSIGAGVGTILGGLSLGPVAWGLMAVPAAIGALRLFKNGRFVGTHHYWPDYRRQLNQEMNSSFHVTLDSNVIEMRRAQLPDLINAYQLISHLEAISDPMDLRKIPPVEGQFMRNVRTVIQERLRTANETERHRLQVISKITIPDNMLTMSPDEQLSKINEILGTVSDEKKKQLNVIADKSFARVKYGLESWDRMKKYLGWAATPMTVGYKIGKEVLAGTKTRVALTATTAVVAALAINPIAAPFLAVGMGLLHMLKRKMDGDADDAAYKVPELPKKAEEKPKPEEHP